MKNVLMFYLEDCGYCDKARRALVELQEELPGVDLRNIQMVEESLEPEFANRYDYYAVPTFYVDGVKLFEAHISMSYADIKREVRRVLEAALGENALDKAAAL